MMDLNIISHTFTNCFMKGINKTNELYSKWFKEKTISA